MNSESNCCGNSNNTKLVADSTKKMPQKSGCMICGEELIYHKTEKPAICYYCGETKMSDASCKNEHYVCDNCHQSNAVVVIKNVCYSSKETDAAVLMQLIRSHSAFAVHGPEHHSLVPAVIITVLRNLGKKISNKQIDTAIHRGQTISGGSCAFLGVCGAATGVGIAYSLLLEANPTNAENRQKVQQATAIVMSEIASYKAARCCQRDSWIALKAFSKIAKENLNLDFEVSNITCSQHKHNKECIYNNCPLWKHENIKQEVLYSTWSVCPICLKRVPAQRIKKGQEVFLKKTCVDHGDFETIVWRGFSDICEWVGDSDVSLSEAPNCPDACGLCSDHKQNTCCVVLNVTDNCNLSCSFCLANQCGENAEPSLEELVSSLSKIVEKNKSLIQLSGGEPTTRNDLPLIVKAAKYAGAKYVQLNSNGIRLGEDLQYVKQLADAGLSFVFMQFDGTEDDIYKSLRGKSLLKIKLQAIENCAAFNIGVTLVPTLVRGINLHNVGEILRFAISASPKVRGVHFQPATYTGRVPETPANESRITLDELLHELVLQSDGLIKLENLLPSACDHPLCGFHGDFIVTESGLLPLLNSANKEKKCCCDSSPAELNRNFVGRRWQRPVTEITAKTSAIDDIHDMEYFLQRSKSHGFTVTSMAFQDAGNLDFSRLQKCSLHVYDKGKIVPFCSHFLTAWKQ